MILESIRQDLRYAVRGLRAHPAFAFTVVVTMALGMGANATMFGIIDRLLFRGPDQIDHPESVVLIETRDKTQDYTNTTFAYAAYTDYRDHPGGFSSVGVTSRGNPVPLGRGRDATHVSGALASATFFTTLRPKPALGRFFTVDEDDEHQPQDVAVIGYGFWQQHFGGRRDVLGKMLDIGTQRFRIVGVAPKGFTGVEFTNIDVWLPITAAEGLRFDSSPTWTKNRGNTWLTIVARVKPGVNETLAAEQATAVHRESLRQRIAENPQVAKYITIGSEIAELVPLVPGKVRAGAGSTVASQDVKVSRLLAIVSFVVLMIACANVANLLLVRGFTRRREIAVRLALGVGRGRLITQLLIEGILLASLGAIGALLLAHWTSHGVRTLLLGQDAWTTDAIDGRLLAFTSVMTIATGVITSLVPALSASRTDVASALKAGAREGGHHSPVRATLLVVQAALALVLLTGAGLFLRSVANVNALPLGVDVNRVVVADIRHKAAGLSNSETHRLFEQFASDVRHVPGVTSAAVSIGLPFSLNWGTQLAVPGRVVPKLRQGPAQYAVTPDYFATLGIPIVAGRSFTQSDRDGAAPVAIISVKTASIFFPQQNPVAQCVKVGGDTVPCATIVGVAANTVRQGIEDIVPQVYRPLDQLPESFTDHTVSFFGYELVVRTAGDASRYVEPVRRTIQSASANVPYANVRPMRDLFGRRIRTWELGAKVFSAFGLLALLLAAVGLYSVLAFSLAQRAHEFGVRIALGARPPDLVRLTVSKGLVPILYGIGAGVVLALLSGRFVESLLFKVSPNDPSVIGSVCAILLGCALAASLAPALRATRVDPAMVLRTD